MLAGLKAAPMGSQVLLHSCAHNPTGIDPTEAQENHIADLVQERKLVAILDSAYQGCASADLDKDAYSLRLFLSRRVEFFVSQSFAKHLGLYGERTGMLHAVCKDKDNADRDLSQLKLVVRPMYSSPPIHGAHLVMSILGNPANYNQWKKEQNGMADGILEVWAGAEGHWAPRGSGITSLTRSGCSPTQGSVRRPARRWRTTTTSTS